MSAVEQLVLRQLADQSLLLARLRLMALSLLPTAVLVPRLRLALAPICLRPNLAQTVTLRLSPA
jgi:hypothetical protein